MNAVPTSPPRSTARRSTSCTSDQSTGTRPRCCSLHTYPGSFAEFLDLVGPLTDPVPLRPPDDASTS